MPVRQRAGFTAIELIVVLASFVVAIAVTLPFLGKFQQQETITTITHDLQQTLRRAQNRSMHGQHGQPWGLAFTPQSYTLYAGPSFSSGRIVGLDEVHVLPDVYQIFAPLDLQFTPRTGRLNKPVSIRIQGPQQTVSEIQLNPEGAISIELP